MVNKTTDLTPDAKKHLIISVFKSTLRCFACIGVLVWEAYHGLTPLSAFCAVFLVAEFLGLLEEMV